MQLLSALVLRATSYTGAVPGPIALSTALRQPVVVVVAVRVLMRQSLAALVVVVLHMAGRLWAVRETPRQCRLRRVMMVVML
tara:strand:- start:150 stop:395 length:246 start_codon:yes stop_codon:yes gene_type:complete